MEKMTIKLNGKNYEVWATDAVNDCNNKTYSALAYNNENKDLKVGIVIWETTENWGKHTYNQETGKCNVESCDGTFCEDESNACDWEEYEFEIAEYIDMTEEEIISQMKELK